MKKHVSLIIIAFLVVLAGTTFLSGARQENTPKDEVVYGILDHTGDLSSLTVINSFTLKEDQTVVDYGKYDSMENLSSQEEITTNGSQISFAAEAGRVSYQGTIKNGELPWTIKIQYYLDGERVDAEDLIGKTGKLEIRLRTLENTQATGDFFDDYALQITVPLDQQYATGISTSGANLGQAGSVLQLSYIVLPGEEGNIKIQANIQDFQMDPIQFAGIRMSFDISMDPDEIKSQLDQLLDAAEQLDDGAADLVAGAKSLKNGLDQYTAAFGELNSQLSSLVDGMNQLDGGLSQFTENLSALSQQGAALQSGAQAMVDSAFAQANAQLDGMGLPELTPENYQEVLAAVPGTEELVASLTGVISFADGVNAYTGGVTQLADGSGQLSDAAGSLADGVSTLADGIDALYDGAADLNSGMSDFLTGISKYREGTSAFASGLSDSQQELTDQLDLLTALLPDEGRPFQSFVSEENTAVNLMQFVMKTPGLYPDEPEETVSEDTGSVGIWEKLTDLFTGLFD